LHGSFVTRRKYTVCEDVKLSPPHRRVSAIASRGLCCGPDRYDSGCRTHPLAHAVTGVADPGLYAFERFGNFTYTFSVAPGSYTAAFYFSEFYHGTENPVGGVGSRLFDVYFNGNSRPVGQKRAAI
jgi:hypothetical protein